MEKKTFVKGTFSETISEACSWIDHLEYDEGNEEIVTIVCRNGYTYKVNVTADSKTAIVSDVMREINRH